MATQNIDKEFTWDSEIEKESEFIVLPAGEYDFTVVNFERGRHEPKEGGKLPACPMANVQMKVEFEGNDVMIFDRQYLHSKMEGMLGAFFNCLGLKRKDEKLKMDWNKVPGATGRFKLGVKTYNGNESNEVKRYLPKDAEKTSKATTSGSGNDPWR